VPLFQFLLWRLHTQRLRTTSTTISALQYKAAHIPAAAVVIIRTGKPPKITAYGTADMESNVPATTDTAFQLASATKLFTGVLLMRMVEEAKIALADPVSKDMADMPPRLGGMTIMELASHSSGLPDALTAGPFKDIYAVGDWAAAQPALSQPSVQSIYSHRVCTGT
jgi:CubicO group peptidase (beta-lactamase class C family)